MPNDLLATRQRIQLGDLTASAAIGRAIEHAQSAACCPAFLQTQFDEARDVARQADASHAPAPISRLAGLPFSVKDLFDVAGQPTRAGSQVLAGSAPAQSDSPAVARLKAAGGAMIGRTHMVEFAFSGVGTNPHFPTPAAWDGRFGKAVGDPGEPRIPGGSSSGAGVSVAMGAAFIGLGSDTGGSIRIPAALNGIVGFKSTAGRVPTEGAIPLSTTLDTVCALTRSVRDAVLAHEILAARRVTRSPAPLSAYRIAIAQTTLLDGLDETVLRAFQRTLNALRMAGAKIDEIPLSEIGDLSAIQSTGGFSAAESYAWHRQLLASRASAYDPRVAVRIQRGAAMKAHEYIELVTARRQWIRRVEAALARLRCRPLPHGTRRGSDHCIGGARSWCRYFGGRSKGHRVFQGQRLAFAQHQRGEHARRLRPFAALPCRRRTAGRPDGLAWRHARRHRSECRSSDRGITSNTIADNDHSTLGTRRFLHKHP